MVLLWNMYTISYNNQKPFFAFVPPVKRAAIIVYMQAKGRPFCFNDVIWFHQVTVPLFGLNQIQSNDMTQSVISSETHTWYMYTAWEIETPNLGLTQMASPWGVGGQNIMLILALMCFLWNNLWSVCRYVMGSLSGWWRLGRNGLCYLTAPLWKCRSRIGDHRFIFFMDLLPNYTFYTNLTTPSIGYLLIEYVTSLITFNLWKVEKSM